MTPEKWKLLIDDARIIEKPFLYLYHACLKYPWWVYSFFFAYCVAVFAASYGRLEDSDEFIAVLIFLVGFGPVFFFFSLKITTWVLLRVRGFRAEDLRIE